MTEDIEHQLSSLKLKRAQIRRNLTNFRTFIERVDFGNLSELTYNDLKFRLDKFMPGYDDFSLVQLDISCILQSFTNLSADEKAHELDEKNYFDDYFDLIARAKTGIENYEKARCNPSQKHSTSDSSQKSNETKSNRADKSNQSAARWSQGRCNDDKVYSNKLPPLKLPSFSGKIDKWLEFKDAFLAMVGEAPPVQKLQYLRSCLSDEALDLTSSLLITDKNWNVAWSLLTERYENNRLVVDTYIQGLLDAPVLSRESYSDLRKLFDTFNRNVGSLEALNQPTDKWDTLLIAILVNKFDNQTRKEWEAYKIKGIFPTWNELHEFLKNKCALLEKLELTRHQRLAVKGQAVYTTEKRDFKQTNKHHGSFATTNQPRKFSCYHCKADHSIFLCDIFKKLSIDDRNLEIRKLKLCLNCFNPNHMVQDCQKMGCRICSQRHNSLLHRDKQTNDNIKPRASTHEGSANAAQMRETEVGKSVASTSTSLLTRDNDHREPGGTAKLSEVSDTNSVQIADSSGNELDSFSGLTRQTTYSLLSTALVNVIGTDNELYQARILVDSGSQSNFISEEFSKKVGAKLISTNFDISSVGNSNNISIKYRTKVTIHSRTNDYSRELSCLVLKQVTSSLPLVSFSAKLVKIPKGIPLADPTFNISRNIDILLGVDAFYDILLMEQIKTNGRVTIQKTQLGWVIGGELTFPEVSRRFTCNLAIDDDMLNQTLVKFWQIEEPVVPNSIDDYCEKHFLSTYEKDPTGRFVVQIPFKDNLSALGDSKTHALRSLNYLKKKFEKNPELKHEYSEFISEFESLGHMTQLTNEDWRDSKDNESYYLPHHAIIKESSLTCRLRVVFNASSKTSSGLSLNDVQFVGPTIQNDLVSILTRFRKHKYVLNADVSKMFRQIWIHPQHRPYQRILWPADTGDIICYELNTVVYGMASSPFLAVRCLHQVASEFENEFPLVARIIRNDMYMDDLLTGTNDETELLTIQRDISMILANIGFDLRKWLSNKRDFFDTFEINDNSHANILPLGESEQSKTLGLYWNAYTDTVQYRIRDFSKQLAITKRKILSISSQIFDPLGLVQPVIVVAKLIIQSLWKEKSDWDSEVPEPLLDKWNKYCLDMKYLNELKISRFILSGNFDRDAFSDASEKAVFLLIYSVLRVRLLRRNNRLYPD